MKKNSQRPNPTPPSYSNNPVSEAQKRWLTFGAMLFYYRAENMLEMKPVQKLRDYVEGLDAQWGVSDSQSAKKTLNDLLMLHRSNGFEPLLQEPPKQLATLQKKIAKERRVDLATVEQTRSAYAWDTCRAASLAKWRYWCGYLIEEEAWATLEAAAEVASQLGQDWTEYTVSFLPGRSIHGFDLDMLADDCKDLLQAKRRRFEKPAVLISTHSTRFTKSSRDR